MTAKVQVRVLIKDGEGTEVDVSRTFNIAPAKAAFGIHPTDAPKPGYQSDDDAIAHVVGLATTSWKELTT